ncbi:PE family protein [Mycobacterium ulcerans]|uniref:PE family protein n=1 Tax=Mycobacterium ulcerans TaxID=1809 RepID=UPI0023EF062A|nr:PE family protein [Mycobacterium ulcerans]
MSYVVAAPDFLSTAAEDLAAMGSAVSTATAAAARSTTLLLAAGADEVSTHIAALFSTHGLQYQLASAQAAEFHERFVLTLAGRRQHVSDHRDRQHAAMSDRRDQRPRHGAARRRPDGLGQHRSHARRGCLDGARGGRHQDYGPGGRTALLSEIPHRAALSGTGTPAGHSGAEFGVDPAGI